MGAVTLEKKEHALTTPFSFPLPHLYSRPLVEQLKIPGYLVFPMGEKDKLWSAFVKTAEGFEGISGECHFVRLRGRYGWKD